MAHLINCSIIKCKAGGVVGALPYENRNEAGSVVGAFPYENMDCYIL